MKRYTSKHLYMFLCKPLIGDAEVLKAVFLDARLWRYVLKELAEFLETVGIKFSPTEGVKLKAMDPSHVMLVDLSIPATAFEEYDIEK
ncbi:MAG: hypothetical protein QW775_00970, partial [Ignisphaera sp.]